MTYALALSYLASLNESRIKPGLERIREVLPMLGNPHFNYPQVLVGGTNGKGSVVAFMGSVLAGTPLRTGLFTSPHLHRFEERIVVDQEPVDPDSLTNLVETVKSAGVGLTYFEFGTAAALLHFAQRDVGLAILEVGIGGRWDATNVTDPVVSVITSVDFDHQNWLGRSLEEIALEKAGILRSGRPAVIGPMEPAARDVILRQADAVGAQVFLHGRDYFCERQAGDGSMRYEGRAWRFEGIVPGMKGLFQVDNAGCAISALECLAASGYPIQREDVVPGIESARWPGRFQTIGSAPPVIVDSAHNRAGIKALIGSLDDPKEVVWLFSALADKDVPAMAGEMASFSDRFVLAPLQHPRALALGELEKAMPAGADVKAAASVARGIEASRQLAGSSGCVVAAGSVVLAGEVIRIFREEGVDV